MHDRLPVLVRDHLVLAAAVPVGVGGVEIVVAVGVLAGAVVAVVQAQRIVDVVLHVTLRVVVDGGGLVAVREDLGAPTKNDVAIGFASASLVVSDAI